MNSHIVEKTVGSIKNVDRLTDLAAIEVYHTTHDTLNKYEIMKEHATQKYTDEEFYQESVLAGVLIGAGIIGVAVSAFFIIKKIIDSKAKGSGESGGGAAKTTDLTSEQSIKKTAADFEKQINDAKIPGDHLVKLPFKLDATQVKALMDIFSKSKDELVAITDASSAEDIHKVIENLDANAINNADPAKIILREETQCKASDIVSRSEFELLVEFTKIYKDYYAECEKIEKKLQKAKKDNPDANIQVSPEDQKKLEQFTNAAAKRMNELTAAETKFIGEMEQFIQTVAKAVLDEENAKKQQQQQQQQGADAQNSDQDAKDKPEVLHYHPDKPDPGRIPDTAEAKANKKTLDDTVNMLKSGKSEEDVRNALAQNNYNNDQINAFLNEAKEIAGRKDKIIKALMTKGKSQTVATAIATDVCDKYNGDLAQYMNAKIAENQGNAWADNEAYKNCMIIADVIGFDKASITKPSQGTPEQQNGPENADSEGSSHPPTLPTNPPTPPTSEPEKKSEPQSENSSEESKQSENTNDRQLIDELKAKIKQNPEYLDRFKKKNPDDAIPDNIDWWMQYVMDGPYEDDQYENCLAIAYNELLKENPTDNPPTPSSFENYRDAQGNPAGPISKYQFSDLSNQGVEAAHSAGEADSEKLSAMLKAQQQQPTNPPSTNVAIKNKDNIIQQASFDGIPDDIVNNICDNAVNDINSNIPFDAASRIKNDAAKLATDQKLSFADAAKRILKVYENAAADMEPQTDAVKKYIEDVKQAAESDLSSLEPEASAEQLEDVNAYATKIFETINSIPGAGAKYAADIAKSRYNENEKQMIVDDIVNRLKATGDANKIAQADEFIKAYNNAINPLSGNENESKPSISEDSGSGANSNNSETTTPSEGMISTKPDHLGEYYGAGVEKSKQSINTNIKNALDKIGMSGTVNGLRISGDTIINTITQSISNMGEYASPEAVCRSVDEILNNSVYKTIHDDLIQYKRKGSIVNGIVRVGNALHKNGFMSNFGEAITTLCAQIRDVCAEFLHIAYNVPLEIINRTIPKFESYRGSTEGVGLVYSQWFKEYELDLIRDKKIQMIMESQQQEEQKSE